MGVNVKKTLLELMEPDPNDDVIVLMVKIAWKHYEAGELTKDGLMVILKKCINARAVENGYAEKFGMPFRSV